MNLQKVHYVMLTLLGVISAAQYVAENLPGTPSMVAHIVSGLAASLLAPLAVLSPSASPQAPGAAAVVDPAVLAAAVAKELASLQPAPAVKS